YMPKRTSIMLKNSLRFTPLGPFMTMFCAIFIDRGNSTRAMRSIDAAVKLMQNLRISLWICSEGTRNSSEHAEMLSLKKGCFHLANYWHIYHKNLFESGVRVLPPISTAGLTAADVPVLVALVRDQMLAALIEISTNATPNRSRLPLFQSPGSISSVIAVLSDVVSEHAAAMPENAVFEGKAMNRESLADSAFEGVAESENGTETEEDDEGMVLVGGPA
ncbi:hypothetical protein DFH09DRAFT_1159920, partial [Mycena vulgaris]